MLIALVPLAVSAGGGYILLQRGVIAPFNDVSFRQRDEVGPAQHLRLLMWDSVLPVDEYLNDHAPVHPPAFRNLRGEIEKGFADLLETLQHDPATRTLVQRARDDWTVADRHATELISVTRPSGDTRSIETMQQFHGAVVAATDKLEAAYEQLAEEIERDHEIALLSYERSMWLAGIAGTISLLAIGGGVLFVGRIMAASVDRLVDGASRFAQGDRHHRIEVQVPPELHRVAEEFNYMIERIHESESSLAELAHRDSLTGLSNRRAFDEAAPEIWARLQTFGEPSALLAIDIDHFKRVNDTHGHAAGDQVLRTLAKVMTQNVRPYDKVFRIGGEEFAVLLPKTDTEDAREGAERLRQVVASTPVRFKDVVINPTVSIGIAQAWEEMEQSALVEAADAALYQAKLGGRNRVVVSGEEAALNQDAA